MAVPSSVGDEKYIGPLGGILHSNRCHPLKIKVIFYIIIFFFFFRETLKEPGCSRRHKTHYGDWPQLLNQNLKVYECIAKSQKKSVRKTEDPMLSKNIYIVGL